MPCAEDVSQAEKPSKDRTSVLWVGSDSHHKNLAEFLRALPPVLEAFPDCEIVIAGIAGVPPAFVSADRRVRWAGRLQRRQLLQEMASSDIVVVTSRLEAGPLVPIEAARARTPIIASNIPPHASYLTSDSLYPLGDHRSLATKITTWLREPDRRSSVAEQNFELTSHLTSSGYGRLLARAVDQASQNQPIGSTGDRQPISGEGSVAFDNRPTGVARLPDSCVRGPRKSRPSVRPPNSLWRCQRLIATLYGNLSPTNRGRRRPRVGLDRRTDQHGDSKAL